MAHDDLIYQLEQRMQTAYERYGDIASTHEALGVASEEWDELRSAIKANDLEAVEHECIDLAAICMRLARGLRNSRHTRLRSVK